MGAIEAASGLLQVVKSLAGVFALLRYFRPISKRLVFILHFAYLKQ